MARQIIPGPVSASGLTHLTEGESTVAPNDVVPVVSLTAIGPAENIDAAFMPKGDGALLAAVPDGTTVGGEKRGAHAVDLQIRREGPDEVASGSFAVVGGGRSNKASGEGATVPGGEGNVASGMRATVGGGVQNTADAPAATIPGGYGAHTRGVWGKLAFASAGTFDEETHGQAQTGILVLRGETEDETTAQLTSNGDEMDETNINILSDNCVYRIVAEIVAFEPATGAAWTRTIFGAVKRLSGAGSVDYVGTGEVVPLYGQADTGTSGWNAALSLQTSLGGVTIAVTGAASKTIRWVATMYTTEVMA